MVVVEDWIKGKILYLPLSNLKFVKNSEIETVQLYWVSMDCSGFDYRVNNEGTY